MYSKHSLKREIVVEASLVSKKNDRLFFEMMQQNTSLRNSENLGAQWDEFSTKVVTLFSYTVRFQDEKKNTQSLLKKFYNISMKIK